MPSHENPLVCNSVTLHSRHRATVTVRSQAGVYRPDAVRVTALCRGESGSPETTKDVSDRVRVLDVEWQRGSCGQTADIRLGREMIDQLGPLVALDRIPNRALLVAQDISCTIESEWPETVDVTVQFEYR